MRSCFQPFPMEGKRRAQVWRYQPQYRRPRHFHDQSEFNLVTRGSGRFRVGNTLFDVHAGQFIGFVPGCEHELLSASSDLELFALGFEPALLDAYTREHGRALCFVGAPSTLDVQASHRVRELCSAVETASDRLALERQLVDLASCFSSGSVSANPNVAWRAADALTRDAERSRDALARSLGINRSDLSRAFRHDLGLSLPQYKNRLRILEFVRRLDAGTSMITASRLVGFGSYSQCHRAFTQLLGCTPREFIRTSVRAELAERFEPRQLDGEHPTAAGAMGRVDLQQ